MRAAIASKPWMKLRGGGTVVNGCHALLANQKNKIRLLEHVELGSQLAFDILTFRTSVAPYCPSYSVAFKAIFLVRALAATYSNISDCDEVFNFWEPMHYLQYGTGLETWEYSPVYAIRSWTYILVHALPAEITRLAMSANRVSIFLLFTWHAALAHLHTVVLLCACVC